MPVVKVKPLNRYPKSMTGKPMHYCPGCGHGVVHRLIAEIVDELGIREKTIGIAPVGCAVIAYDYWDWDMSEAAHGRVAAVATGIKRVHPDKIVFGYQGDGDLAAIGLAETMHAANRGENITIIFINNANYGMTGGQMAPTTLVNQVTATTPRGRNPSEAGYPLKMAELISQLEAPYFVARTMVTSPKTVLETKMAIKKAFRYQMEGKGYSLIEILSACPTNWRMSPVESVKWIELNMTKTFPPGIYKDKGKLKK